MPIHDYRCQAQLITIHTTKVTVDERYDKAYFRVVTLDKILNDLAQIPEVAAMIQQQQTP